MRQHLFTWLYQKASTFNLVFGNKNNKTEMKNSTKNKQEWNGHGYVIIQHFNTDTDHNPTSHPEPLCTSTQFSPQ